ncbi:MAG: Tad domain-containing protein [Acetobacter sp.]|nr:Tad domain-containing protein [Acetobacter sp.]
MVFFKKIIRRNSAPNLSKMPENSQKCGRELGKRCYNKGAVGIIFAICLPVLALAMAVAINIGSSYNTQERLQMALDAAGSVLAASGTGLGQYPSSESITLAQEFFVYTFCDAPGSYSTCYFYGSNGGFLPHLNGSSIKVSGYDGYGRLHITATAYAPLISLGIFPKTQRVTASSVVVFDEAKNRNK